jgi:hypothetical protein
MPIDYGTRWGSRADGSARVGAVNGTLLGAGWLPPPRQSPAATRFWQDSCGDASLPDVAQGAEWERQPVFRVHPTEVTLLLPPVPLGLHL